MPIRYRCRNCDQLLSVAARMRGQALPCPRCGDTSIVPAADEVTPARAFGAAPWAGGPGAPAPVRGSPRVEPQPPPEAFPGAEPPEEARVGVEFRAAESGESEEPEASPEAEFVPADAPAGSASDTDDERFESAASAGGFKLRSRKPEEDEMDLTPMVDMTFLLLIFFMITASFSVQKSLDFPAPSPEQKGAAQTIHTLEELESSSIVVRIDDRNAITVDDEPVPDPTRLADTLRAALSTQRNELILSADDLALHETVVQVIDAANEAGMQRIRMTSHSRD